MWVEKEQLPVMPIGGSRTLVRLTWAGSQAKNKQDKEETSPRLNSPLGQQARHGSWDDLSRHRRPCWLLLQTSRTCPLLP
ncbi:hypothetical protein GALMADRAFT_1141511 [Galerina marginata CBS 339.88]|uniref:Uncharacterized protein n=1 Tax=Galerina marginata (strain CBS 339.88) TaxID=685588 RepID=A0A067S7N5_GALM3|nr:hypothetical protein GALMADRAFT_1141511 [Galerina marginata CBS 339.88]